MIIRRQAARRTPTDNRMRCVLEAEAELEVVEHGLQDAEAAVVHESILTIVRDWNHCIVIPAKAASIAVFYPYLVVRR